MFMLFLVPARFATTPKESVTAYKTFDTILTCDIFGYPTPKVTWRRSALNKKLPINRHVISGNKLTILNTTEEDKGAYICQGDNRLDSDVITSIWITDVKDVGKRFRACRAILDISSQEL